MKRPEGGLYPAAVKLFLSTASALPDTRHLYTAEPMRYDHKGRGFLPASRASSIAQLIGDSATAWLH